MVRFCHASQPASGLPEPVASAVSGTAEAQYSPARIVLHQLLPTISVSAKHERCGGGRVD